MEIENNKSVLDIQIEELLQKEKIARQNNENLQSAQILKQLVNKSKIFHFKNLFRCKFVMILKNTRKCFL